MNIDIQQTFADISEEYAAFEAKFRPKKTTDDCYTPEPVYEAVKDWAFERYGLAGREIVRPFWPGADYERCRYPEGCVVIDNPPFSILSQILRFYIRWGIDYFLFSHALTLFSNGRNGKSNFVVCGATLEYANGAKVPTSFVTSLGENVIEVRGDLYDAVTAANEKTAKPLPKYDYPDDVATAAALQWLAKRGGYLAVPKGEALFTRRLDAQDKIKESGIFGGGFILSRRATQARQTAERAAREREQRGNAYVWRLSERERALQDTLEHKRKGKRQ